jgi:hypothetical protein
VRSMEPRSVPSSVTPCPRCGSFVEPEKLVRFLDQGPLDTNGVTAVCTTCADRMKAQHAHLRLYPLWYITTLGVVSTFAFAGVLAGINWKRLGDERRKRICYLVSAAVLPFVFISPPQLSLGLLPLGVNIAATLALVSGLKAPLSLHRQSAGARANLIVPLVAAAGIVAIMTGLGSAAAILAPKFPH